MTAQGDMPDTALGDFLALSCLILITIYDTSLMIISLLQMRLVLREVRRFASVHKQVHWDVNLVLSDLVLGSYSESWWQIRPYRFKFQFRKVDLNFKSLGCSKMLCILAHLSLLK